MAWLQRYVRADAAGGGDGTTNTNSGPNGAWTITEALADGIAAKLVNIKSGTYAPGAILATTVTGPVWWKGFNITPGDLDDVDISTNFPHFDLSGGNFYVSAGGANNIWENIKITSGNTTSSRGAIWLNALQNSVINCDIEGTANDVDAKAILVSSNGDGSTIARCKLKSHATATSVVNIGTSASAIVTGCHISGGVIGIDSGPADITNCIINGTTSHGIQLADIAVHTISNNTLHSIGGNGIQFTSATTIHAVVTNNIFSTITGYAVNSATINAAAIYINNNLYYNINSGGAILNNIYELRQYRQQTDIASPFIAAGSNDFRLASTSTGRRNGSFSQFLQGGVGLSGQSDIGALQVVGGKLRLHPGQWNVASDSVDQSIDIDLYDTDGNPQTSITSLTCYYRRGASGAVTQLSLVPLSDETDSHVEGGYILVDNANMPGILRLDLSDAMVEGGADYVNIYLNGPTNMMPRIVRVQIEERVALTDLISDGQAINATAGVIDAVLSVEELGTQAKTDINTEVADVVRVDTVPELTAVPPANATLEERVGWLFMLARNKLTQNATIQTVLADDGTTTVGTSTLTPGVTTTRGEFV